MKVIVLGSGTCVPSLERNAPGYYLEVSGKHILVDCGSGTILQLEKAGKSYRDINAVFVTHIHPDHISDLMPFIHALVATPGYKRKNDLLVVGPKDFKNFFESCISFVIKRPRIFIKLVEIEEKLDLGYLHIFSRKTVHSENSIAYRFEDGRKSLVITGDCDYDEGIIELSRNTDLLIADCSFPDSMKVAGHLTPKESGLIARKAEVKKLVLSHIYPAPIPDSQRLQECRSVFDGHVLLAEDLMEINV